MEDAKRKLLELILRETSEVVGELLEELETWLRTNRREYFERLQPGVSIDDLDAFEKEFGIVLPLSFRLLYQWRNGQPDEYCEALEGNRSWMSLEEVADKKRLLDDMIGTEFEDPNWWKREWVPFLANGGGDHLCLDLSTGDGDIPPRVIAFWHDWDDRSYEYPSMQVWLNWLVRSMEDGTYETL